jgi:hypothetical protein
MRWEHTSVSAVVSELDDALTQHGGAGWEAYAAVPLVLNGPGVYDVTHVLVLMKRPV